MRKYFTRRCLFLHALVVVVVPAFLLAGWWQYTVARGGNDLSWVYTVEWPFFAAYGIYMWWKLIHDRSTPFDRLWAAKQRAAAQASGTPFYEIPGWATDKELVRELRAVGIGTVRAPGRALGPGAETVVGAAHRGALPSASGVTSHALPASAGPGAPRRADPVADPSVDPIEDPSRGPVVDPVEDPSHDPVEDVVDDVVEARVLSERADVDEELEAYNRYLFELHQEDAVERRGRSHRS